MITQRLTEIAPAAEILRAGGIVAFPTETVYGLGADAFQESAVRRIFEAKGRPEHKPISLLTADAGALDRFCREVPAAAWILAEAFWPGPLTLVLRRRDIVPDAVTGGRDTVGVRCPDHPMALALLRAVGGPLATPSANRSGAPSATDEAMVLRDLDGRIDAILMGGVGPLKVASTVLDLTGDMPRILRQGLVTKEQLETALGGPVEGGAAP